MSHRHHSSQRLSGFALLLLLACVGDALATPLMADFLRTADQGHCIEALVFRKIQQLSPGQARAIVRAAAGALSERASQQNSLGCEGDIAAQAIAAGADPDEVLSATAAGL